MARNSTPHPLMENDLAPPCSICMHDQKAALDRAIVEGQSIRALAPKYGVHRDSLARHSKNHISPALVKVVQARQERGQEKLLDRVERVVAKVELLLESAEQTKQITQALAAVRELKGLYELVGRLTGELKPEGPAVTVNILQTPEVLRVIAAVRHVLADQPERLAAFSEYLRLPEHQA